MAFSVQAVQVRKSNFVPDAGMEYHPDSHHECTIFAATVIRQVCGLSVLTPQGMVYIGFFLWGGGGGEFTR